MCMYVYAHARAIRISCFSVSRIIKQMSIQREKEKTNVKEVTRQVDKKSDISLLYQNKKYTTASSCDRKL